MISAALAKALNEQIGHEFGASMQYVSIAAHFQRSQLTLLAKLFFEQADEERQHAMKFVKYLLDTKGELRIPEIPAATPTFASAEGAVQAALTWFPDLGDAPRYFFIDEITAVRDWHIAMKWLRDNTNARHHCSSATRRCLVLGSCLSLRTTFSGQRGASRGRITSTSLSSGWAGVGIKKSCF